jgi:hypothetical protein
MSVPFSPTAESQEDPGGKEVDSASFGFAHAPPVSQVAMHGDTPEGSLILSQSARVTGDRFRKAHLPVARVASRIISITESDGQCRRECGAECTLSMREVVLRSIVRPP